MNRKNEHKFIVDFMLGRLTKWLRIFGYDTVYLTEPNRAALILRSLRENRTVITRDHKLSRKRAWKTVLIESDLLREQLGQLIAGRHVAVSPARFFTRCTVCNGLINPVEHREEVKALVPEYVYATCENFSRCSGCGKVYWAGTHRDLLLKDLARLRIKPAG
ncbi:MAG: Mut7-C RNAse domain-containing protein [Endomicrobiales bacterium]